MPHALVSLPSRYMQWAHVIVQVGVEGGRVMEGGWVGGVPLLPLP